MEWLAAVCLHIPNRGEQMVIYHGFFNTVRDYSSSGNPHPIIHLESVDKVLHRQSILTHNKQISFILHQITHGGVVNCRARTSDNWRSSPPQGSGILI